MSCNNDNILNNGFFLFKLDPGKNYFGIKMFKI